MKTMMKMLSIIALMIIVTSCVTTSTPVDLPDKYNLDADLQSVTRLHVAKASKWEQVDDQSVMFAAAGGKRYLLVLDKPLEEMSPYIGVLGNSSSVLAGQGKIYVGSSSKRRYYTIEKIYELEGVDQVKKVKEQLSNN